MKKKIWMLLLLVVIVLTAWILWANTALEITEITLVSDSLPDAFAGMRIAHVSDLHNAEFGENNEKLLEMLRFADPDIIAITGDLIDSRHTDIDVALAFAREAVKIAPCYYATGNHEAMSSDFAQLEQGLIEAGVTVLRGAAVKLEQDGQQLQIIGADDYSFYPGNSGTERVENMVANIQTVRSDGFNILLFHRPELAQQLEGMDIELILSGHAHGGQVRIPFIGGLVAPDQGFFPVYTEGVHNFGQTQMVISRGLGNSIIPIRVNNRPEVVLITLQSR